MGIGESIKKGFGTAKQSIDLVSILFMVGFVWNLISIFLSDRLQAPGTQASVLAISLGAVFILFTIFMQAGSLGYILHRLKQGTADLSAFTAAGTKYYLRLLGIGIIVAVFIGAFVLVASLIVAFLRNTQVVPAVILVLVLAAITIYFVILLFLSPYISVADDRKAWDSVRKSMSLVGKGVNPFLGIVYVLGFLPVTLAYMTIPPFRASKSGGSDLVKIIAIATILMSIGFGIGVVLGAVFAGLSVALKGGVAAQAVFSFFSSLVNAYLGVVVSAAFMSFYLGLRPSTE